MIAVGVDPGSIKMGYGVVRVTGARLEYVTCGLLSAPAAWPVWRRLCELGGDLGELTNEINDQHRGHPEDVIVGIEAGFIRGQQGALVSASARGVALFVLGSAFGEVRSYAPATIKKAATGTGRADKEQVQKMVMLRLGLNNPPGFDECDALAVGITRAMDSAPR